MPKGAKLQLVTDDFDNAAADRWFPVVNVDLPHVYANHDMLDWPILCIPKTACPQPGVVAAWDHFLEQVDDATGDRFVPVSAAESGGILAIFFLDAVATPDTTYFPSVQGYSVSSSTPAFPIGYQRYTDAAYRLDCDTSFDLYSPSRLVTDGSGGILSFGDPAYTGSAVTLTITDMDSSRNHAISNPWEIPVAPGMITLGIVSIVNGVPNQTFRDLACAVGFFTCDP